MECSVTLSSAVWSLCVCVCVCVCRSEIIVTKFMELDLENDNIEGFLQDFVIPTAKDIL